MAYDFVDGIPPLFGTNAERMFTPQTATLLLRATGLSMRMDTLAQLRGRWAAMEDKRLLGVRAFANAPKWEHSLTLAGHALLNEAIAISYSLHDALKTTEQQSRFLACKVAPSQWEEAFENPFYLLKCTLQEQWDNPDLWKSEAKRHVPLISKNNVEHFEYTRRFEKDLSAFERVLPSGNFSYADALKQSAGPERFRGR